MKKVEIKLVAATLADFLEAGLSLSEAVARLHSVSPKYSDIWDDAKRRIMKGYPFSDALDGVWDDALVAVLRSGESSGNVAGIFRDIEKAIDIELHVSSQIRTLYYPAGMLFGGLFVGLIFMVTVIPGISQSLGETNSSIIRLSVSLQSFIDVYYPYILIGLAGIVAGGYYLFRSPSTKGALFDVLMSFPALRRTITELKFGIWTRYLSLALSSNLGTIESLRMTEAILPGMMGRSVSLVRSDLQNNVRLEAAVNMSQISADDPRQKYLPFFVSNAFTVGANTGQIASSLSKASPALIRQGTRRLESIVGIGRAVAIGVAALAILSPLGIVYSEMFKVLDTL